MLNLIRKDLLMHKMGFPIYVPILVGAMILQACRGFSASVNITLACIYGAILPTALLALEDRLRTGTFNCSLPVTRSQIVHAKYAISWVLAAPLTLTGLIVYSFIAAESFWAIWTVPTVGQVLVTLSLGLALTLPIMLRFGWWGLIGAFLAWLTLWVVTFPIVRVLVPGVRLEDSMVAISTCFASTRAQLGGPVFLVVIVVACAALNLVSCRIAAMLFKTREF